MPNELTEVEVDEVSLVDRPATGKRFVLFKRGGLLRRASPDTHGNICSQGAERLQQLEKRAASADDALTAVREATEQLERRLASIEAGCPPRMSQDSAAPDRPFWAGVL